MNLNELDIYLNILWNKLGIKDSFQKIFNNLKENKENKEAKKDFTSIETEKLEKFEKYKKYKINFAKWNIFKKLSLEIEKWDKSILLLQKLIEVIEKLL